MSLNININECIQYDKRRLIILNVPKEFYAPGRGEYAWLWGSSNLSNCMNMIFELSTGRGNVKTSNHIKNGKKIPGELGQNFPGTYMPVQGIKVNGLLEKFGGCLTPSLSTELVKIYNKSFPDPITDIINTKKQLSDNNKNCNEIIDCVTARPEGLLRTFINRFGTWWQMQLSAMISDSGSVWNSKIPVMRWLRQLVLSHNFIRFRGRFLLQQFDHKPFNIIVNPICNKPRLVSNVYEIYKWIQNNNANCLSKTEKPRTHSAFIERFEGSEIKRDQWGDEIKL